MNSFEKTSNRHEGLVPVIQGAKSDGIYEIPYVIMGNPDEAKHIIFESTPYFTPVSKPHYQLRLKAHQEALGEEFCVVGVDAFSSRAHTFSRSQLKKLKEGDFSPLSERVFRTIEEVGPSEEQTVSVGGYSLGGDVSIQAAYDTISDDNRGIVKLTRLKAIEPARVADQSVLTKAKAFGDSSNDFFLNVLCSDSDELLEAFGIDKSEDIGKARKKFDRRNIAGVIGYLASAPLANKALMQGLATDKSIKQLDHVLGSNEISAVLVGTSKNSGVSSDLVHGLINTYGFHYPHKFARYRSELIDGDHSADDNIIASAMRQARFGGLIVAATI